MIPHRFVLLAIFIMISCVENIAQKRTFSVSTEEVRLDILVTAKGKTINDLTASDFQIFDNGVPQAVQYLAHLQDIPVNATLLFDMSRSMAGEPLVNLRNGAKVLLAELKEEDHAALIMFNQRVFLGSPFTREFALVRKALDQTKPYGNSSLIDASLAGLELASSQPGLHLIIIFSDGLDTFSWLTPDAVLDSAIYNDAVVYAVSTRRKKRNEFLKDLSDTTGGSFLEIESTKDLSAAFLEILNEFRQRYLVTYIPQGVATSGWHKVDVKVKRYSANVKTRPGYARGATANKANDVR